MTPRVLIVDDDEAILGATRRVLHDWLCTTCAVPLDPSCADVALLDWEPHGEAMVRRCLEAGVPFVIMTGNPAAVSVAGATVITKPFLPADLDAALRRALFERQERGGDGVACLRCGTHYSVESFRELGVLGTKLTENPFDAPHVVEEMAHCPCGNTLTIRTNFDGAPLRD